MPAGEGERRLRTGLRKGLCSGLDSGRQAHKDPWERPRWVGRRTPSQPLSRGVHVRGVGGGGAGQAPPLLPSRWPQPLALAPGNAPHQALSDAGVGCVDDFALILVTLQSSEVLRNSSICQNQYLLQLQSPESGELRADEWRPSSWEVATLPPPNGLARAGARDQVMHPVSQTS